MGKVVGVTFPKPEPEKPVEIKVIVDSEPVASVKMEAEEANETAETAETVKGRKQGGKNKVGE